MNPVQLSSIVRHSITYFIERETGVNYSQEFIAHSNCRTKEVETMVAAAGSRCAVAEKKYS